jgi:hypothetical protein
LKHRASPEFWKRYRRLPPEVQGRADESHALLLRDERHPSLRLKKVGQWWSVRIGAHYRALAIQDGSDLVWFWIGSHAEYDRLIRRP